MNKDKVCKYCGEKLENNNCRCLKCGNKGAIKFYGNYFPSGLKDQADEFCSGHISADPSLPGSVKAAPCPSLPPSARLQDCSVWGYQTLWGNQFLYVR